MGGGPWPGFHALQKTHSAGSVAFKHSWVNVRIWFCYISVFTLESMTKRSLCGVVRCAWWWEQRLILLIFQVPVGGLLDLLPNGGGLLAKPCLWNGGTEEKTLLHTFALKGSQLHKQSQPLLGLLPSPGVFVRCEATWGAKTWEGGLFFAIHLKSRTCSLWISLPQLQVCAKEANSSVCCV